MSAVNHPSHYGGEDNPYEAIKVIEAHNLGFHLGNAIKYILRAGKKTSDPTEDLNKAIFYLNRHIQNQPSTHKYIVKRG
jgi:ABC-type transporter lipoprotein component MlaA